MKNTHRLAATLHRQAVLNRNLETRLF